MFRVSRIVGAVMPIGEPGAYEPPADIDLRALTESLAPPQPHSTAQVRVRAGAGNHYLIYSFDSGLRVLNGFLQSLVGLYDYAEAAGQGFVIAEGRVLRWGGSVGFLDGDIRDDKGRLVVHATSTVKIVRPPK